MKNYLSGWFEKKCYLRQSKYLRSVRLWFHLQRHHSGLPWFVLGQLSSVEILWIYKLLRPPLSALGTGKWYADGTVRAKLCPRLYPCNSSEITKCFLCLPNALQYFLSPSIILFFLWHNLLQFSQKKWWWTNLAVTFSNEKYHNTVKPQHLLTISLAVHWQEGAALQILLSLPVAAYRFSILFGLVSCLHLNENQPNNCFHKPRKKHLLC